MGRIVWQSAGFRQDNVPVRDANRLLNSNTLITGSTKIVEITPEGEIVWQLTIKGLDYLDAAKGGRGLYKADRISVQR